MGDSNRTITSGIRRSQSFAALDFRQRDFWHGLIAMADDQGRLQGHAQYLKSAIWPYDDIQSNVVEEYLQVLAGGEDPFIHIYDVKGKTYIQIVNWWKYQKMTWAGPSTIPAPAGWIDRLHYHGKGNVVITHNWHLPGGFEENPITQVSNQDSGQDSEQDSVLACDDGDGVINGGGDGSDDGSGDALPVPVNSAQPLRSSSAAVNKISRPDQLKIWNEAMGQVQREMGKADFDTWMRDLKMVGMNGSNNFKVMAVNTYARDWVQSRAGPMLLQKLRGLSGQNVGLVVLAENDVDVSAETHQV